MSRSVTSDIEVAHAATMKTLTETLGTGGFLVSSFRDNLRIAVPVEQLVRTLTTLQQQCGFCFLAELGCTDYLGYPERDPALPRYEVHYILRNLETLEFLVIKVAVSDEKPTLPSVYPIYQGADWMEREVYDMYGITFDGHPDLRRILMPDEFTAFPLRKDYPLRGRGERHNFPRITRDQS